MDKNPSTEASCSSQGKRIENRPSEPLVVLGHGTSSASMYNGDTAAPETGLPSAATTRPLISTASSGFGGAGFARISSADVAFGSVAGLALSDRGPPAARTPKVARARAARPAVVANLILVISISLKRTWVRNDAPDEAGPPVAASTVARINAGDTAAEASFTARAAPSAGAARPRRISRPLSRCRALESRQRSVGTVQRS